MLAAADSPKTLYMSADGTVPPPASEIEIA